MPDAVIVERLTKRFDGHAAVEDVSFSVKPEEIFGLIGSNGAGKTTLIKMLITLLPPTSGRASVAGFDVADRPTEVRRRIGYVPQLVSADGALTGYENMVVTARLYGIGGHERHERIATALESLELGEAGDRLVQHYSGGMIRRLEIAMSMLHRPAVLFMDEPTVGLDPIARRTVWEHVRTLRKEMKTTIILTTHYMEEAEELCERVALMNRGRLVVLGTPAELKANISATTLEDVFVHYTGTTIEETEAFGETRRERLGFHRHG